jgi:predicted nicotinamide N-methyase
MKLELLPTTAFFCPDDPGEPGLGAKRWSVCSAEARILSELFRGLDVLEIGTGLGISTNTMAEKARSVHTVDIDPWVERYVVPTLANNVHFYKNINRVIRPLDAAFIDGLHSTEQCAKDIKEAMKIVKNGGLIVLHDANMNSIRRAIIDNGLECYEIKTNAGMAFGWNDKEKI